MLSILGIILYVFLSVFVSPIYMTPIFMECKNTYSQCYSTFPYVYLTFKFLLVWIYRYHYI